MESENVLTDNVNVAGPVLLEMLALLVKGLIGVKSDGCNIV